MEKSKIRNNKKNRLKSIRAITIMMLFMLSSAPTFSQQRGRLGENIKEQLKTFEILEDGQKKVIEIDEKTQELLREYRLTLRKIENTKLYNEQLVKLIASQGQEKESVTKQIEEIQVTNQEIVPLMVFMVDTLDKIIGEDSPFLKEERVKRVEELKLMMSRADVSNSEKYRRILEAYMIENDYGRTLEAYRGLLAYEGQELTVDYLRVGRVSFLYQTLDGRKQAIWNQQKKQWLELGSEYRKPIREALKIARKQLAPDLIKLPLLLTGR